MIEQAKILWDSWVKNNDQEKYYNKYINEFKNNYSCKISQLTLSPLSTSIFFLPTIVSKYFGFNPKPGLILLISLAVIF